MGNECDRNACYPLTKIMSPGTTKRKGRKEEARAKPVL
jgi:hypothetical protein